VFQLQAPGIAPSVTGIVQPGSPMAQAHAPAGRITGFGGGGGGFGPEHLDVEAVAAGSRKQHVEKARKPSPAVLDVDRRVFSRILVSPDVMVCGLATFLAGWPDAVPGMLGLFQALACIMCAFSWPAAS